MATTKKKPKTTKKPTTKVSSQQQSWADQSALESLLRFRPQESVLEQAYSDAQHTYRSKVQAAKTFNALQQTAIGQAAPAVDASYAKTAQAQGAVNSLIHDQVGKLQGDAAAPFQTAAMLGAGTAASNLLGEQANAKRSYADQSVQSAQGATAQAGSAQGELVDGLTKILSSRQDLAAQKGAYEALTYEQLHTAAQKLAHETNLNNADNATSLDIAAGHDATSLSNAATSAASRAAAAKDKAKGKGLLPGGAKPLTTLQTNAFIGNVKNLSGLIKHQRGTKFAGVLDKDGVRQPMTLPDGTVVKPGQKLSDHAMRQLLTTPNNPTGKAYSHDEINAAFDVAVLGALSAANITALHKAGIKIQGRLPTKASRKVGGSVKKTAGTKKPVF